MADEDLNYYYVDKSSQLHKREMEAAAKAAKAAYLAEHPDAEAIVLRYDPLEYIKNYNGVKDHNATTTYYHDYDDGEVDYDYVDHYDN